MNRIENYIDSIVPKNLPKKKKQLIRDEIGTHIYERVDFYKEIGYDENASVEKALADMGEDEEVKSSIRNEFEELHAERTWWAVVVALAFITMNMLCLFTQIITDSIYPTPRDILESFVMVLIVILVMILLYRKGFRKSLNGLGISHILIIPMVLWQVYSQCAVYGVVIDIHYILEKCTPLVFGDDFLYELVIEFATLLFLLLVAISCFILSLKIKKHGKPKRKTPIGLIIFCVIYFVVAIPVTFLTEPAEKYFDDYPEWFSINEDSIIEETDILFSMIDRNTDYDDVVKMLYDYGYVSADAYEETLDRNTAKKFRYNLNQIDFFFEEDYEVFFNPLKIPYNGLGVSNGFVFLLKGDDGRVKSKGIGDASTYIRNHSCSMENDLEKCVKDFKSLRVGDSETEILSRFGKEYAHAYAKFTTYTETGEDNYYRFHCDGNEITDELPGTDDWSSFDESEAYIEFNFTDGKITDGKINYITSDEYYRIFEKTIALNK